MRRVSAVWARVCAGKRRGACLLRRCRAARGHRKQRGIVASTIRRWESDGWVKTSRDRWGNVVKIAVTAEGITARNAYRGGK